MEHFTPLSGLIGGVMIGLAAIAMLYFNGKLCGISGIFAAVLPPKEADSGWRALFLSGLIVGGFIFRFIFPSAFDFTINNPPLFIFTGGLLIGFGSRVGMGCTSGHGICGIGRLAIRSVAATMVFFICGVLTASIVYFIGEIQ